MHIINRMITYTFNARDQTNCQVTTLRDIDTTFHVYQVDTTHWLIYIITQIKDVMDRVVEMGTLITMIIEGLRI